MIVKTISIEKMDGNGRCGKKYSPLPVQYKSKYVPIHEASKQEAT